MYTFLTTLYEDKELRVILIYSNWSRRHLKRNFTVAMYDLRGLSQIYSNLFMEALVVHHILG